MHRNTRICFLQFVKVSEGSRLPNPQLDGQPLPHLPPARPLAVRWGASASVVAFPLQKYPIYTPSNIYENAIERTIKITFAYLHTHLDAISVSNSSWLRCRRIEFNHTTSDYRQDKIHRTVRLEDPVHYRILSLIQPMGSRRFLRPRSRLIRHQLPYMDS
jgi:hypothetical protein